MTQSLKTQNMLDQETSPYLLQHADNPVHWQPWTEDTFAMARTLTKPVLLSIGYSACHWCHVMAHESFEDPETASVMNEHFINIKVDREERPDVDAIYQSALALLGEHGGWPLTMFLTPKGEPFWGGTYFPAEPRYGRPAFAQVLNAMAKTFHEQPDQVQKNTAAIKGALAKLSTAPRGAALSIDTVNDAARNAMRMVDPFHGGTMGAPKFPQPSFFGFLWSAYRRSRSSLFRDAVTVTLDRMCNGGIYDHLGGGFARYSVDEVWLAPHFEKMLYDNALLVDLMTEVWKDTQSPLYRQRIEETIDWLLRDMKADKGDSFAFVSAFDADSEGEEGKFYVWSETEIDQALGDDAALFKEFYDVSPEGNWEGKNILRRTHKPDRADDITEAKLLSARSKLLELREKRIPPGRDDKVLADWNGLTIAALIHAGAVFEKPDWIAAATSAFDFIVQEMTEGDRLKHSWCQGRANHPGVLDDYAAMARAAIRLFEVTNKADYLARAESWMSIVETAFKDEQGGYFIGADDTIDIFTRSKSFTDSAVPSGNGLVAEVLTELYLITGNTKYQQRADALFEALGSDQLDQLINMPTLLGAFASMHDARQIVIIGSNDNPATDALWRAAITSSGPKGSLARLQPGEDLPESHPAHGKGLVDGKPAAYLCHAGACGLPLVDPETLRDALQAIAS